MTISSIYFLLFFLIVLYVYYVLPQRWRWVCLLVASYAFYATLSTSYVAVLLVMTLVTYGAGLRIAATTDPPTRKCIFRLSVVFAFLVLGVFKYTNFGLASTEGLLCWFGATVDLPRLNLFYPIGIAFFSLQMISYLNDVYSEMVPAETHLGRYMLYTAFFPKLIAGPIERADNLLPQFAREATFDYQVFVSGLIRIGWGFWKKLVIADRLAAVTANVFNTPVDYGWLHLVVGVFLYSLQIYADFSAYCDIVIGAASILGIKLTENFNYPYFASSPIDFWRRWHISFSNWLRDYIFYPLNFAARRHMTPWIQTRNILLVFLFSGLWHGAAWTFVIWGGLHGVYQAVELALLRRARQRKVKKLIPWWPRALSLVLTFLVITFAWIFFRANSVADALTITARIFTLRTGAPGAEFWVFTSSVERVTVFLLLGAFVALEAAQYWSGVALWEWVRTRALPLRWALALVMIFSVLILGYYGATDPTQFIYSGF